MPAEDDEIVRRAPSGDDLPLGAEPEPVTHEPDATASDEVVPGASEPAVRAPLDPLEPADLPPAPPQDAAEDVERAVDDHDEFAWLNTPDDEGPAETAETGAAGDFSWLETPAPAAPATDEEIAAGWRKRQSAVPAEAPPAAPRVSWYERLRQGLARSSDQLTGSITALFTKRRLDEDTLQDFEDVLIQADLGVETAMRITDRLSDGRFGKEITGEAVRAILADEVEATLKPVALPLELDLEKKPHVILVVGVNGTGKTTTIGKLAAKLTRGGLKVTLCAGDTFRAAAVEQLKIWGERTGAPVIARQIGADAAGLAFEAYDAALANGSDVLIIDTAGRLQNKAELMAELEKINRVLQKREPDAPHTVLQTLDATTGQNALSQVEIFRNVAGVNGLVMTKLDGTARGGILVAIAARHRLPVYFIGVGEGIDDLEPFKARDFARAIAGTAA
ncbi:signal recognition particle-docking protein FtsY [Aurantimonas sp. MSK8Z-1]|nr:signal recognition particle-docking protein FtsY [Aurantimonas sp. MSK8Z-1]MCW4116362.1 signal recognition particle-docking protein FtsY [Aurantimonas sp. MSK8Z-1]